MAIQNVSNNPLGNYPVLIDKTAAPTNAQRQAVGIDFGTVTGGVLTESRVSATNPLPVTATAAPGGSLEDYHINDLDDTAVPKYYGFENKDGAWYIMRESPAKSYRYASGSSNYSTAWTNRASQTYTIFSGAF